MVWVLRMSVTIDKVAQKAGVSKTTVSRFLNNRSLVSPATAETILQVIQELDFIPNSAARNLVRRRTDRIGLIIGSMGHPFWSILFDHIVQRVSQCGFLDERYETLTISSDRVVLYNSIKNIRDKIKIMVEERVAGLILGVRESLAAEDIDYLASTGIPCVIIQCVSCEGRVSHVSIDNYKASYEAAAYLLSMGHRRIAYVCGPPETTFAPDRLEGYKQAMIDRTRTFKPEWVLQGNNLFNDGYWRMCEILSWTERPTAVMFASDFMAYGTIKAASEQGVGIPQDLSIMGFDGLDVECDFLSLLPPLTTVHQPIRAIGEKAVDTVMKMIRDKAAGAMRIYSHHLKTEILDRGTCARLTRLSDA